MTPKARLTLIAVIIVGSVVYGALVAVDTSLASAIAVGYVAALLTIYVVIHIGKRHHERHQ